MKNFLTKHGKDYVLVIDQYLLGQLNISIDTPLDISIKDRSIVITPIYDDDRTDKFKTSLDAVNQKYSQTLKKLAK